MKSEIIRQLEIETRTETTSRGNFTLPDSFTAFEGHFPEKKILPGFVHLLISLGALEKSLGASFRLHHISQARFKSPVLPGEKILWSLEWQKKGEEEYSLNASFLGPGGEKKSDLRLEVKKQ